MTISACEACGAEPKARRSDVVEHGTNCIAQYSKDGSCLCGAEDRPAPSSTTETLELKVLMFHGRKLELCAACYEKEQVILRTGQKELNQYDRNVPDKIENVLNRFTKENLNIGKWQEVYTTERPNWVVSNFASQDEMKEKLIEFICSMERLAWEAQTRKRAAFDAAKELDARMSKSERDALINDPSFKPASNSEFKKIAEDRALDEIIKTIGIKDVSVKQRKAIKGLVDFGLSPAEIKATLKL